MLIADACRALDDEEGARLELQSARQSFADLQARHDLHIVDALLQAPSERHSLSARELHVLQLVAAGKTNRSIASELFLSERTVHRHVSHIFDKLGVRSRTEAATYALEHQLLPIKLADHR